jgi:hypothetical protein
MSPFPIMDCEYPAALFGHGSLYRKRTGPETGLVVTRRLRVDESIVDEQSSPAATEHDGRYRYRYDRTLTRVSYG